MSDARRDQLLSRLNSVRQTGDCQWEAVCPAHEDNRASLSISSAEDGRILLHCHAGCDPKDVVRGVNMEMKDLFPRSSGQRKGKKERSQSPSPNCSVASASRSSREFKLDEHIARVIGKLKAVQTPSDPKFFEAPCPCHDDGKKPLSVAVRGERGRQLLLLQCIERHCELSEILEKIGESEDSIRPPKKDKPRIVATYDYRDASGKVLFQVVRYSPKSFRQRQPDGKGGWIPDRKGCSEVLYRLPELIAAVPSLPVFIVESEKTADLLASLGLVVTCSPGGAGKWRQQYGEFLVLLR